MERWDILNSAGEKVGKTVIRGKTNLSAGEYHLVVHIWVHNSEGKFLIQRRSENKRLMPGEWAATGGAAISGEDSFTAAARELKEELGIESDASSLEFVKRIKRRNSFIDVYSICTDVSAESLHLQKSEVDTARWVTKDYLKTMIKEGKFHDYGRYYWSVVFGEKVTV
ncbi:MAG: NUDIX domain-containing protein [Clostridiales bacterium]|nr:NUDIX domain-containing protein [Candidatus Equinaster intestinalis]